MHRWFKEYLSERHQFTVVKGKLSKQQLVKTGVPQGSSLGPLLFIIYINDIQHLFAEADHFIYADDTNLFISDNTIEGARTRAQKYLDKVAEYMKHNSLVINKTKTEFILIDFPSMCTDNLTLNLDNFKIPRVKSTKLLGNTIDEHLKFDVHIDNLVRSLRKFIPLFYKIRDMMPLNILLMLHEQLRLSKIRYCLIVFGSSNKTTK